MCAKARGHDAIRAPHEELWAEELGNRRQDGNRQGKLPFFVVGRPDPSAWWSGQK